MAKMLGQFTFRLPDSLEVELVAIADAQRRRRSDVARFLFERGLAAYKRDGKLFEPEPGGQENPPPPPGTKSENWVLDEGIAVQ